MPYKRRFLALWIFHCLCLAAIAQPGQVIRGRITDSTGTSLESVTIKLLLLPDSLQQMSVTSDRDGSFSFSNVPAGNYILSATFIGYRNSLYGPYTVEKDKATLNTGDLILQPKSELLAEVLVNNSGKLIDFNSGKIVLNVDKDIVSQGNTVFDILRRAPGIAADANGAISMRGRQGITILLDGKPLNLSPADVSDLLRNMSSDQVDQIELISNPSSDYDAAGNAGVINIKQKKNLNTGTNGSLLLGSGYGENYKVNTSLALNHRQRLFDIYGSWTLNDNKRTDRYRLLRAVGPVSQNTQFDITNHDIKSFVNHDYRAGADYFLGKDQALGFMFTGMHNHMFSDEDNHTFISNNGRADSTIFTLSDESRTVSNNAFNLNYKGGFKHFGSIGIDIDYLTYRRRSDEDLSYFFYDARGAFYKDPDSIVNRTPSHIDIKSLKIDYSKSLTHNDILQAGIKNSVVSSSNRRVLDGGTGGTWLSDSFLNDEFDFKERIYAVYANYNRTFRKEQKLGLGLRGEYTRSSGRSVVEGDVSRDYFNLFPYVNFSFKPGKDHQASFLYNRRINRPAYDDLNPFRYFLDQYTYREGNPYLGPEYSSSIEFSDTYKEKLSATLSYNYVKDYYLTFTEQNDSTKVSRYIKRNLQSYKSVGIELNYTMNIASKFNSNLNVQGYYRRFNIDQDTHRGTTLFSFSDVTTYKMPKGLDVQLSFNYESPSVSGVYNFKAVSVLDAGIGKSVLKNKGLLRLAVSDIFNSDRNRYYSNLWNLDLKGEQKTESRVVRLNFTYKFGRKTVKPASDHKTGSEQESKRVSN